MFGLITTPYIPPIVGVGGSEGNEGQTTGEIWKGSYFYDDDSKKEENNVVFPSIFDKIEDFSSNLTSKITGSSMKPTLNAGENNAPHMNNAYTNSNEILPAPSVNDNNSSYNTADFLDYLKNLYSGNLDYNRTLEILNKEMTFNREESEKNRKWQEYMSNTAYQRAVEDLKKAGYNPALILGQGGASSPTSYNASVGSHSPIGSGNQMTQLLVAVLTSAFDVVEKVVGNIIPNVNISQIFRTLLN